jgi:hypothetical protein
LDGNRDVWNCRGDHRDYRPFPVLFGSNSPIYMAWENCSKKGEDCPFHDHYIRLSTHRLSTHRLSTHGHNLRTIHFLTDPKQKGTIQEIIDQEYGTFDMPCMRHKDYVVDSEPDNKDDSEPETNMHSVRWILTIVHMMG